MTYSSEIKKLRQKCFLSQEAFARELEVSFSSCESLGRRQKQTQHDCNEEIKGLL